MKSANRSVRVNRYRPFGIDTTMMTMIRRKSAKVEGMGEKPVVLIPAIAVTIVIVTTRD